MPKILNPLFAVLITGLMSTPAIAEDPSPGSALHAEHCTACHDSSVYTRDDRRVTSLKGLGTQVMLCNQQIGLQLFDDELTAVVDYLNQQYYHLK